MKNINKKSTTAASMIALVSCLAVSNVAKAANEHVLQQDVSAQGVTQFELDAHVGTVKVSSSADDKIHIYVKVSEKDGWGVFKSSPKDAKLTVNNNHGKLSVSLNDDDYGEEWHIQIPQLETLDVDLGVGEMTVKDISANLQLDVGVGEVKVYSDVNSFGVANVEAGVGAAQVKASSGTKDANRAMVSEEVVWRGTGQYKMDVEVGVGDASITLD
ncbi:hypothetical protein [Psychrobium sp. 1_MG-2023]|uniref:hypothetical protein n=1 Tax=Psychrobium sp. 1_MG-2023 TaxID=3062624 RepID=UPI000C332129|nr:hypothetical protein [Psychrobium sp. 1_MG-2023]MDP2560083.1 hypothetical protein [Psychrobium sp. 1_MG-2023]PKF56258.1 hypothetical protein CW748_09840 [Alteromonadales bacterium alter-6D02]